LEFCTSCIWPHRLKEKLVSQRSVRLIKKGGFSLSHICLLLSAIIPPVPSQTPSELMVTQEPLKKSWLLGHRTQSFGDPVVQVRHDVEHRVHCWPSLNVPIGHVVPFNVTNDDWIHCVVLAWLWVKPCWQLVQIPVSSAQLEHPRLHTERECVCVVKKRKGKRDIRKSYFDNHRWMSNGSLPHTEHMPSHF
jgi:hypothetical protein